jgi:hypothetical protein
VDAVADVEEVERVADDHRIGRLRALEADDRTAAGAERREQGDGRRQHAAPRHCETGVAHIDPPPRKRGYFV